MGRTPESTRKAQETIRNKYGVDDEGKSLQHKQAGKIGGKKSTNTGFALMDKDKLKAVSAKGGTAARCKHTHETLFKQIDDDKFYSCDDCHKVRKV